MMSDINYLLKDWLEKLFDIRLDYDDNIIKKTKLDIYELFYYIVKFAKNHNLKFKSAIKIKNITINEISSIFNND